MQLSRQLLKQFANITNNRSNTNNEATVYGTVVTIEDSIGSNGMLFGTVRLDGSTVETPVTSAVKIRPPRIVELTGEELPGDRVIVRLKNHSATVISNVSDPSASGIEVTDHGLLIEDRVTFGDLERGTTTIDGACIKTGTIAAERLNLNGAITFDDLDENMQVIVDGSLAWSEFSPNGIIEGEGADWSRTMREDDMYRRDTKDGGESWNGPYQFRAVNGKDGEDGADGHNIIFQYATSVNGPWYYSHIATRKFRRESTDGGNTWSLGYQFVFDADDMAGLLPSYITKTKITETTIESPEIYGGVFYGNDFQCIAEKSGEGGLSLFGYYGGRIYHFFRVAYNEYDVPRVDIMSPDDAALRFDNWYSITFGNYNTVNDMNPIKAIDFTKTTKVSFDGEVDLSGATNINFGDNVPTVYAVFR